MFLGWYDPDTKKDVKKKLADAKARYTEKFGREPKFCLTSPVDAAALGAECHGMQVHARAYIATFTFYIGENISE